VEHVNNGKEAPAAVSWESAGACAFNRGREDDESGVEENGPPPKRLRLATIPEIVFDGSTQARNAVENALSRGIEGAKFLLHVFEEKRTEVSSKHVGAVTNASDGASSSSTVASRDLLVSTDQSGHSI
ncbi:unnamed protein product, partial [Brassica oleracea var. botrytis]